MRAQWRHLEPRELDHELIWSLVGLALMGSIIVGWRLLGPAPFPKCAFHAITGQPCLTCGSTRALIALSELRVADAIALNPLCAAVYGFWMLSVPYGLIVSLGRLRRLRIELGPSDWFALRFLIPLAAVANWAWVIWDGR